jgi:NADH-quinone oxidoreductase subunit L
VTTLLDLVWLIPALPLAGFLILVAFGRRLGEPLAGILATVMIGGSFIASAIVFIGLHDRASDAREFSQVLFTWVPAGSFRVDMGFLVDPLSITMCLFVTGIGTLIHLYSIGYMHGDPKFSKFFLYLNLFAFSMLMLVLGNNLLITFVGWEGVGTCSYFLISFWHTSKANATAGKKAFVTNRIGDWGFTMATFLTFTTFGTIQYIGHGSTPGFLQMSEQGIAVTTATAIVVLAFVGAAGKSAQFPLYLWLPDAMAGPTPVSALIHAATMVTSGVYLMTRLNPVIAQASDWAPSLIAWVGAGTALYAATIAIAQNDIKKVLAYSTVSQLGYMFLAVGSGAYVAAVFHMITHAFFKALLFLGSGSVIHGMHDDQDMRHYGRLQKFMPITAFTFIAGWLAIAGVPPFSGFWSKDEILAYAYDKNPALWVIGVVTALLTAYYMTRQVIMTFWGDRHRYADPRPDELAVAWAALVADAQTGVTSAEKALVSAQAAAASGEPDTTASAATELASARTELDSVQAAAASAATNTPSGLVTEPVWEPALVAKLPPSVAKRREFHPHESGPLMWIPLVVLAFLAVVGGVLNLPFSHRTKFLGQWLEPVVERGEHHLSFGGGTLWVLALIAIVLAVAGIAGAVLVYRLGRVDPRRVEPKVFAEAWYYDATVAAFMGGPGTAVAQGMADFDSGVIDGAVNGTGNLVKGSSGGLRKLQNGLVRSYALGLALGAVLLVGLFLTRASF